MTLGPVRLRIVAPSLVVLGLVVAGVACGDSGRPEAITVPTGSQTAAVTAVRARIKGSGASFPDAFYQEAVAGLGTVASELRVTYEAVGSAAGREAFALGLADFAGTDSLVGPDDGIDDDSFRYIPTTAASIAVVYNLPGVDDLNLDGDVLAGIFQRDITSWDDPAIAALNDGVDLPATPVTVARRSDGAGTTKNFTAFLDAAAPDVWTLGSDDTVEWPADTEGGQQNTGVAQIVTDTVGGVGYVDYGNAVEIGLQMAAIGNSEGNFVAPSIDATAAALDGAELGDDLTYDPLFGPGADAYPITAPTYLLVRTSYGGSSAGAGVVGFVRWLVTDGADTYASEVGYAPLPARFRAAALSVLDGIGGAGS